MRRRIVLGGLAASIAATCVAIALAPTSGSAAVHPRAATTTTVTRTVTTTRTVTATVTAPGPTVTVTAPGPTTTVTVTATPSATPTDTPTPTPTTTAPPSGYPTPSTTGVPAGTVFTNTVNGEYDVTTAGQIIDGWHITGALLIHADNITIRNSEIEGGVWNQFGSGASIHAYPYTIADSTLGPRTGCQRIAGLQSGNYTADRVLIHNVDHGFDFSEPGHVAVRDSYITECWLPASVTPPDGSHVDGVQSFCPDAPCTDLEIRHNYIDDGPAGHGTFTINLVDPHLAGQITVADNLLRGGSNYVIVMQWRTGPNFTVSGNKVIDQTWGGAAPASAEGTCAHQDWQGNSIVTVDANQQITGTVAALPCID